MSGRSEEAKRIIEECEEKVTHDCSEDLDSGVIMSFAVIHWKLGDKDRAFEWISEIFERCMLTPFEVKLDPYFDQLTADPRFEEMLKKYGYNPPGAR